MTGSTNVPQKPGIYGKELRSVLEASSSRVLLVGDIHLSDRPPASCAEGYTEDILAMLSFIAKLEKALKIDAVILAGDLFHFKQPSRTSHSTVLKLAKVAQEFDNLFAVVGNHDVSGGRLDSLHKQPLGVLFETGVIRELDGWHPTLPIFGIPWQQRWLSPGTIQEVFKDYREGVQGIYENSHMHPGSLAVTHAPIYPPAVADNVLFELLPLPEVSKAMGNQGFLYYGHIHEPHGSFEVDGVTYANMGALSRGSLHEYNLSRKIQIALWTPETGFHPIDIPHKPASEVFRLSEAKEKKESKMDLESFLSEVGSVTLDISSTGSIIEHVRGMDIEEPVKKTSIELLEDAS